MAWVSRFLGFLTLVRLEHDKNILLKGQQEQDSIDAFLLGVATRRIC